MARKIQLARAKHILQAYEDAHQKLLQVVQKNFGKGLSDGAEWRRWSRQRNVRAPQIDVESRQVLRAQLRKEHYGRVRIAGDNHACPKGAQPSTRQERRALARAYAARDYAEVRSAKK